MIEIKGVSAGYGKKNVLDSIDAVFEKGKITSVIGVNGCGKSTLLKVAQGILPCRCGSVTVDGRDISSLKRKELAHHTSYLAQGKSVSGMTVEQLVLHGRFPYTSYPRGYSANDRSIARDAMARMGISELSDVLLEELSGGIQQNAYIAMALAQDTDYILLDEPTTYLDIGHQLQVMRILRELADSGKGIVLVMHDLLLAFECSDSVLVIADGRCIIQDSPENILYSGVIEDTFGVTVSSFNEKYFYGK